MGGYDKSESTTLVSATVTKGHPQVLAGCLMRHPTRDKMDTLQFTNLEVKLLGSDYASMLGRFHLGLL
jgi:hypothetical protein